MSGAYFNDVSYERYLGEDRLMGCRCTKCGARFVPPKPMCGSCYSTELEWVEMSGKGRLAAFTCIRIVPPNMEAWGYGRERPYCSGVVELEEGGRVVALIDGVDPVRPEEIRIGMPLEVAFLHRGEGDARQSILAFRPR